MKEQITELLEKSFPFSDKKHIDYVCMALLSICKPSQKVVNDYKYLEFKERISKIQFFRDFTNKELAELLNKDSLFSPKRLKMYVKMFCNEKGYLFKEFNTNGVRRIQIILSLSELRKKSLSL
jgi:hypothetical protein